MDFPTDFEIRGPWVPVTPTKPVPTKRSLASSSDWLGSGDVGMDGGPGNSRVPSNWRQSAPAYPSQQMPPCSSNGGEMRTQSFNHPMQMSYRTLLALNDPATMSNMTNLAPLLLSQIAGSGSGSQIMPPAFPNQNQLVADERSSQMMPPASPNQSQLVARERSSQMMPPASPNQNQLAQLFARERSSKMLPSASPNQNQLAQLIQLISRERSRQMMPPASPNHNQLAACESSSIQMLPPASPRPNQFFLNGNAVQASSISSNNNLPPQLIAPKAQYGLPIPLLPNLNSEPEAHMINTVASKLVVSPETPANLGNNMRTQDFRAVEIIDLVDDTAMSQYNQHNTFCQQNAVEEALRSFSSPGMSSNSVALQQQGGEMNVMPLAETSLQQAEGENPGIDLNKTPEPKPKRKKHRPKVIREGKAVKTPKPVTPKPVTPRRAKKTENPPQAKRKYVRKKKDLSSVENPSEELGENANPQNGSGSKPVRRSLNFDTEDCQARDDRAGPEKFTHNAGPQAVISSFKTKSDVQSAQGWGMGSLENSLAVGNSFDLNRSTNQLHNEYLSIPQTPNPPPQHSRQECLRILNRITSSPQTARREGENMKKLARRNNHLNTAGNLVMSSEDGQNQSASDKIYDALLKGTKRNRSLVDDAQISGYTSHMHAYNGMNMGNENCDTRRNSLCSHEIYKRPRAENIPNEGTSTSYSTFTCNPRCPKTDQAAQNTSKAFTFSDAQRFMAYEKMQAFERIFVCNQAEKTANIRQSQAPSTPLKDVDYQRASTPEKPPEFISNHDIMSTGPQARIEALIASNKSKQKARGRKKKEQVPVNHMSSESKRSEDEAASSTTEFSRGQESPSPYSSTNNAKRNNSHFVQDSQGTRKPKGPVSHNSQLGTVVPYRDPIDELVRKLSYLKINAGNKKVTVQEQNALVPYVGEVGPMVVFEGKKRKPRPKVDLDPESDRVWRLLMGREVEGDAEMGADKEKWWEEERRVFRGRAESFIARMHLVQGDRRFSKWKGSVVDSVIGVFLTQNVSDHLSSSAFMSLVAKFPARSSGSNNTTNLENISSPLTSNDTISGEGKMSEQQSCDPSSVVIHEAASADEKEMASSNESPESNTGSSTSDYLRINNLNSHEGELGIGHESPDSGSAPSVTVMSSTSGVEGEDRSSMEDVVSSQNSVVSQNNSKYHVQTADQGKRVEGEDRSSMEDVVSSQNSVVSQNNSKYHVQTADQGKLNSLLNFDSDDLLSGGTGNGFNSFTELLKMANSRGLQELSSPGNGRTLSTEHSAGINQFRSIDIDQMPSLPNPSNYLGGAGPSIYTSNSHFQSIQSDLMGSSYAPLLSSYYQNCLSSNFMGLENAGTVEGFLSDKTNRIEVLGRQCSPSAENSTKGMGHHLLLDSRVASVDTYAPVRQNPMQPKTSLGSEIHVEMQSSCQSNVVKETIQASDRTCSCKLSLSGENIAMFQQRESEATWQVESTQHGVKSEAQMGNHLTPQTCSKEQNNDDKNQENLLEGVGVVKLNLRKEASSSQKVSESSKNASKGRKVKPEIDKKKSFDWDSLRKQACCDGAKKERSSDAMDSLDYEALRNADVNVISHTIRERGMNNLLAERIKEFLNRLVRDHGSTDLEWLRDVPPDKAKDYLLSIRGLGLKSVECVRLLTLHHLAFPVDTNVGRICVRLGWVPLQPLPESLQLHLLEMYPMLETIQKYLWPRLCKLDQRTLYELHYQLITFGKVFCTKSKPNCNACPMRGECKHFASAFASARLALPGPEEKGLVSSTSPSFPEGSHAPVFKTVPLPQLEGSTQAQDRTVPRNCEPIIEEPASPEPECVESLERAIEDDFFDDLDEIPTIKLNMEEFTQNLQSYMQQNNMDLQDGDMSKALVAITPDSANIPMPKLKNVSRLRTEHQVYELPDSHPLLEGLDKRERDDPSPYLLAIWTPGETSQSTEAPKVCCDSQDTGNLCMAHDCFSCNSVREAKAQLVRGTILIPCRTAMRGSFPLNGTYFQVNEVFADHDSSRVPIDVPRNWIWNLPRRTVYFGTSVTTIFKGLTTEGIQQCFWRGFVCVRGFDTTSRSPKPLYARLHFPASKTTKEKRAAAEAAAVAAAAANAKEG